MFTQQELTDELPRLAAADAPPLEVIRFGNEDFESLSSEQCIWAFRGLKRDFPSGLLFWVKTLQAPGWEDYEAYLAPYARSGLCKPVTAALFAKLVAEYSRSLMRTLPSFLTELRGFRSGLRMYAKWNNMAVVAELPEAFVAFYWSTSA